MSKRFRVYIGAGLGGQGQPPGRKHSNRGRMSWALILGATGALALAAIAWASPVDIPVSEYELELDAQGDTIFDVAQPPDFYNDVCAAGDLGSAEDDLGFSPSNDVQSDDGSFDVFDGGLILLVEGEIFEDLDQTGDLVGEQLTVGPTKLAGLRVKRVETALPGSPTLRSLIKFKNKSKRKAKKRTVSWESELGSDTYEVVRSTSSRDAILNDRDRWLVFADDEDDPSDALGTLVLYGKGKGVKKTQVLDPIVDQNGCVEHSIKVKVPKKSSRYLLFFTESHNRDEEGFADAVADAAKYNKLKPGGGVLDGLKKSVRKKVLNWDLFEQKKRR
jgi:hypothetical protein